MARVHNILILQKSKELPQNLREQLRLKNYPSKTVFTLKALQTEIPEAVFPIILVECTGVAQAAVQTMKQIVDMPELCDLPVLLIAEKVDRFKESMDRYFLNCTGLAAPCDSLAIVEALEAIVKDYEAYLLKLSKFAPERYAKLMARERPLEPVTPELPVDKQVHPAYSENGSVVKVLFEALDELTQKKVNLEGGAYIGKIDEQHLIQCKCLPNDPKTLQQIRNACTGFKSRERDHLYRTAFISGQSTKALALAEIAQQKGVLASFLFATAFSGAKTSLLRTNYLKYESGRMREEIGNKIKESAVQIATEASTELSDIVIKIGELIAQERVLGDDENSVLASTIMAADLTDRVCFHSGFWDPFAARNFLMAIRSGKLKEISPPVLACILKLLSEAIAAKRPAHLVARHLRQDPTLKQRARRNRDASIAENETKVDINELEPGMKLSKPLLSFDGKLILSSDLVLDDDLIWRLWQLASIRPLNTPMVIQSGNTPEEALTPLDDQVPDESEE